EPPEPTLLTTPAQHDERHDSDWTAETYALPYLEMGVSTYSSAIFNFLPDWALRFYRAVRARDRATVLGELTRFVMPYITLRNRGRGYAVSVVKAGMTAIGKHAG